MTDTTEMERYNTIRESVLQACKIAKLSASCDSMGEDEKRAFEELAGLLEPVYEALTALDDQPDDQDDTPDDPLGDEDSVKNIFEYARDLTDQQIVDRFRALQGDDLVHAAMLLQPDSERCPGKFSIQETAILARECLDDLHGLWLLLEALRIKADRALTVTR